MKTNRFMFAGLAVFVLLLSACGSATSSTARLRSRNVTLTPETKLALGTLKLEETPQAIDPALAAKLLPLWQLLAQLNTSDATAPQEIQAVVDAIRATMTPDELQSIDGMRLSGADIQSLFEASGSQANRTGSTGFTGEQGAGNSTGGTRRSGGGQAFFFGGGGGASGAELPGGGFGGAAGARTTTSSSSSQSQATSAQEARSASTALTRLLVNRVIQLLQSKLPG
jgi:hypothetical protein